MVNPEACLDKQGQTICQHAFTVSTANSWPGYSEANCKEDSVLCLPGCKGTCSQAWKDSVFYPVTRCWDTHWRDPFSTLTSPLLPLFYFILYRKCDLVVCAKSVTLQLGSSVLVTSPPRQVVTPEPHSFMPQSHGLAASWHPHPHLTCGKLLSVLKLWGSARPKGPCRWVSHLS